MDLEALEHALHNIAHLVSLIIESIAVACIAVGALGALYRVVTGWFRIKHDDHVRRDFERRAIWLTLARWLVAGLTFQLAADVVNTSFSPTWEELGHLAAIAVIRTFLNYFLGREVEEKTEIQDEIRKRSA
ncbi:MAG: DUF1622 domain-containing protein [Variovorax sp.]